MEGPKLTKRQLACVLFEGIRINPTFNAELGWLYRANVGKLDQNDVDNVDLYDVIVDGTVDLMALADSVLNYIGGAE